MELPAPGEYGLWIGVHQKASGIIIVKLGKLWFIDNFVKVFIYWRLGVPGEASSRSRGRIGARRRFPSFVRRSA